jgi:hypothetical protein
MLVNKKERNYISERLQVLVGNKVADINRNHGDIWIDFVDEQAWIDGIISASDQMRANLK